MRGLVEALELGARLQMAPRQSSRRPWWRHPSTWEGTAGVLVWDGWLERLATGAGWRRLFPR